MNHKGSEVHSSGSSVGGSTAVCRTSVAAVTSRTRPMTRTEGMHSWRNSAPPSYFSGHPGSIVIGTTRERPRMRCISESEVISLKSTSFLQACQDAEDNRIRQLMTSRNLTPDIVNCKDKTGKTGVNIICANGNLPLLELITPIPSLDINLGDNEGNTPLHFAAQAGHVEIVHHLINSFKNLEIDQRNHLGFTPLMKASLQGRTKCVKLLLSAGASPILRDHGRGFCSSEWARFCGRQSCAEVLEKFIKNNCSPTSLHKHLKETEKWNSEPNLQFFLTADSKESWFRQKLKKALKPSDHGKKLEYSLVSNLTNVALCASSPLVPSASVKSPATNKSTNNNNKGPLEMNLPKLQVTDVHFPDQMAIDVLNGSLGDQHKMTNVVSSDLKSVQSSRGRVSN